MASNHVKRLFSDKRPKRSIVEVFALMIMVGFHRALEYLAKIEKNDISWHQITEKD